MEETKSSDITVVKTDIENIKTEGFLKEEFAEYKKSEEYLGYYQSISMDKPEMPGYLIELCLFGYFYENYLDTLSIEEREKHTSIIKDAEENKYEIPKPPVEYKGVNVMSAEEFELSRKNIREIKIANPFEKLQNSITTI